MIHVYKLKINENTKTTAVFSKFSDWVFGIFKDHSSRQNNNEDWVEGYSVINESMLIWGSTLWNVNTEKLDLIRKFLAIYMLKFKDTYQN